MEFCYSEESLERVATEIDFQSQEFADLPDVIAKIEKIICHQLLVINNVDFSSFEV